MNLDAFRTEARDLGKEFREVNSDRPIRFGALLGEQERIGMIMFGFAPDDGEPIVESGLTKLVQGQLCSLIGRGGALVKQLGDAGWRPSYWHAIESHLANRLDFGFAAFLLTGVRAIHASWDGPRAVIDDFPGVASVACQGMIEIAAQLQPAEGRTGETPADRTTASVLAAADPTSLKIAAVAMNGRPADERMAAILKLDLNYRAKSSDDWASMLGVTANAIRQTATWKSLQKHRAE